MADNISRDEGPVTVQELQTEVALWAERRWPERSARERRHLPVYRIAALVGRLAASLYDDEMDLPQAADQDPDALKETLGLIVVACADMASRSGWSLDGIVRDAWVDVRGEEWTRHPTVGRPPKGKGIGG